MMASITDLKFEHYHAANVLGVEVREPRISWKIRGATGEFAPIGYETDLSEEGYDSKLTRLSTARHAPALSVLQPWPHDQPLRSRQRVALRIRAYDADGHTTPWSEPVRLEAGLLDRADWRCARIAAPWGPGTSEPDPEQLYRKVFSVTGGHVARARLYITSQGVYEAEINGHRVGDHFLAPGWTAYDRRIQYQTYDVTDMLNESGGEDKEHCIGVRVAEGWFSGRLGYGGGHRNIWGPHTALLVQLEITYSDGAMETVCSDDSWTVTRGPIRLAEIYDGEKYDATLEIPGWSLPTTEITGTWQPVLVMPPLPESTELTAGFGEPVRQIEVVRPIQRIMTPSGNTIVDFGQNLVGTLRLRNIKGPRGHKITLSHAEVLDQGELGTRPLRICKALDEYTLSGAPGGEEYEPRFTFHGFRYAQIADWPGNDAELMNSVEAHVYHTDMKSAGSFSCSEPPLNQLYSNISWGMRGNFLAVPTDCPQRDERLGWTGDLAVFAPTATLIYDCFGILKNWLIDLEHDQNVLGGVPPMVSPNATLPDPVICRRKPCAIWHDVTVLAPWELYQETGDESILAQQYDSMMAWMKVLPRNKSGATHLWDNTSIFQLGDWLDPAAPPDAPWKSATDNKMVANMFLIRSLDLMVRISEILGKTAEKAYFETESKGAREQFQAEYVTANGRIVSDSQTAYALGICFDLLTAAQRVTAGARLAELARKNEFRIATGFAGTPFVCEALAATGHLQVAYAMLLCRECPSWLYPVTMGATTVWERWDSLLPDGSVNPGEMTSFNHYALGAIAKFLYERVAGLQRLAPGWKHCRIAPSIGARFARAEASHETPTGTLSFSWETSDAGRDDGSETITLSASVPHGVTAEIVLPDERGHQGEMRKEVGPGDWKFQTTFRRDYEWPVKPLPPKS